MVIHAVAYCTENESHTAMCSDIGESYTCKWKSKTQQGTFVTSLPLLCSEIYTAVICSVASWDSEDLWETVTGIGKNRVAGNQ